MKKEKLKLNLLYNISYEILAIFLPFILSPYVSRVLGADALGIYSYTYTIANYFVLFSMLGIKNYGSRLIAQIRNNQSKLNSSFCNLFACHGIISIIFTVAYFLYACIFDDRYIEYSLIQGVYVISSIFDISWFYFGIEKFKTTVLRNVFVKLLNLILIFVFVRDQGDLNIYCLIMAVCFLVSQLLLWLPLNKYVRFTRPECREILHHVKPMLVLFIPTVAVSLYKYMDKIMLGLMSDTVQVGFYQNAEQLVSIPNVIINAIGVVMLSKMSNLVAEGKQEQTRNYFSRSMRYFLCLAFALSFGLAAVAENFAPFFWGEQFTQCSQLIIGLAITVPFTTFANIIRTQYLIPNLKDKEYLSSVIVGAVVNIVINALLISPLGALGAVIGTIFAEIAVCVVQSLVSRKEINFYPYIKQIVPFGIIGAIMFLCVFYIGKILPVNTIFTLIIQVIVGGVIYVSATGTYLYQIRDELFCSVVKKIIRRA